MLEWLVSPWQFTAKIWPDTKCNKLLTRNHFIVWLDSKVILEWKMAFKPLNLTVFLCCLHRGSKRCHIVPPASRQKEEPGFLLFGVWRSQNGSSGPPPADERQGEGLGKPGHCGMGWSSRGPGPRGHGQGQSGAEGNRFVCVFCSPAYIGFVWPSPGQGVIREEPGKQRHRGVTGEGVQSVRQAGAGEETQRLRLHPLRGARWCSEGWDREHSLAGRL